MSKNIFHCHQIIRTLSSGILLTLNNEGRKLAKIKTWKLTTQDKLSHSALTLSIEQLKHKDKNNQLSRSTKLVHPIKAWICLSSTSATTITPPLLIYQALQTTREHQPSSRTTQPNFHLLKSSSTLKTDSKPRCDKESQLCSLAHLRAIGKTWINVTVRWTYNRVQT